MSNAHTAISGSRDTTLRVWDLASGTCTNVLMGHQASVRCLEIHGGLVVSGSYDTTAKIWDIKTGQCLRTLQGHFSQIYAIAFDGQRIATGSLDTSVRIWNPQDGYVFLQWLCACQSLILPHPFQDLPSHPARPHVASRSAPNAVQYAGDWRFRWIRPCLVFAYL